MAGAARFWKMGFENSQKKKIAKRHLRKWLPIPLWAYYNDLI
jgi:hypothetical protein